MKKLIFTFVLILTSFHIFAQCDIPISVPSITSGITLGNGNDCDLRGSDDLVYSFTVPAAGDWVISTCSMADFNTYLFLGLQCCNNGVTESDARDGCTNNTSYLEYYLNDNITYYLTVEGANNSEQGSFMLEITPAQDPTCTDGIQNGDETGVDCGGSSCQPCVCDDNKVVVSLTFDQYASETIWKLTTLDDVTVVTGINSYTNGAVGSIEEKCLENGCYKFVIGDTFGDGMCCNYGDGFYLVTDADGNTLASGGDTFTSEEVTIFCVDNQPTECSLTIDSYELQNINAITGEYDFDICYSWENAPGDGSDIINIFFNLINEDGTQAGFLIFDNDVLSASSGSGCKTMSVLGNTGNYTFTSPINHSLNNFTASAGGAYEPNLSFNLDFNGSCITPNIVYTQDAVPTCDDGIMNGNETDTDCGGPDCGPCNCTALTTSNLSTDQYYTNSTLNVILAWAAVPNAEAYQLAGRKQGGTTKVFPETQATSRTFSGGLNYNTTYQWSVRVKCDGSWTDYALPPASFSTGPGPSKNQVIVSDIFDTNTALTTKVYPNPTNNQVRVSVNTIAWENDINIAIIDMTGRIVMQEKNTSSETTLNISNLQEGYYFVRTENAGVVSNTKLVVLK